MKLILFHILLILAVTSSAGFLGNSTSWAETEANEDADDSLLALPYIQYVKNEAAPKKVGTTIYKKDKTSAGYNIYTSSDAPDGFVHLIDMDGSVVHSWFKNPKDPNFLWKQVSLFPDGSIFLTTNLTGIDWELVDVHSHVLATFNMPGHTAHHAAYCFKDGSFLSLVANTIHMPYEKLTLSIRDNALVQVSPEGKSIKTIALSQLFKDDPIYQKKLKMAYKRFKKYQKKNNTKHKFPLLDPFHTNNIENLEWDIPGIAKKGDWLVTARHLDRIFIVDPEKEKIVWQWGESIISRPHHATFLKDGRILLYDNGCNKKSSRIIILDIRSKKIIWQYGQKTGQEFFSNIHGSAQKLPNGNMLIAESDKGRAFEITPSGEIVWEWYSNFYTKGELKGKRRTIYRIERIPYSFLKDITFNRGKNSFINKNQ